MCYIHTCNIFLWPSNGQGTVGMNTQLPDRGFQELFDPHPLGVIRAFKPCWEYVSRRTPVLSQIIPPGPGSLSWYCSNKSRGSHWMYFKLDPQPLGPLAL